MYEECGGYRGEVGANWGTVGARQTKQAKACQAIVTRAARASDFSDARQFSTSLCNKTKHTNTTKKKHQTHKMKNPDIF